MGRTRAGPAALAEGFALLERAITYTLGELRQVTPDALGRPTPCRAWDLRMLLGHVSDSLAAIYEALELGRIEMWPVDRDDAASADPVAPVQSGALRLLAASARGGPRERVVLADQPLTSGLVLGAGAVEIAVHGWDIAQASGQGSPIPGALAAELLPLATLLVGPDDRPGRFGPPVAVPLNASPGTKLIAFLGRRPSP